jgi:hypothetical protein
MFLVMSNHFPPNRTDPLFKATPTNTAQSAMVIHSYMHIFPWIYAVYAIRVIGELVIGTNWLFNGAMSAFLEMSKYFPRTSAAQSLLHPC